MRQAHQAVAMCTLLALANGHNTQRPLVEAVSKFNAVIYLKPYFVAHFHVL